MTERAIARFWAKVELSEGCWIWQGSKNPKGYGHFWLRQNVCRDAHRIAYELLVGSIPDGLTLDHLCRNTSCVRPDHLEPVPGKVNTLRGTSFAAENARKTHCPKGHPYAGDNLRVLPNGWRACVTCRRDYSREYGRRRNPDRKPRVAFGERLGQIASLKAEGLTHRQVAERLGVSEGLISNVLYESRKRERAA